MSKPTISILEEELKGYWLAPGAGDKQARLQEAQANIRKWHRDKWLAEQRAKRKRKK